MNEQSPIVCEFATVDQEIAYAKCGGSALGIHRVADGREDVGEVEPEALEGDDAGDRDQRRDQPIFDRRRPLFTPQQLLECRHLAPRSRGAMVRGESFPEVKETRGFPALS